MFMLGSFTQGMLSSANAMLQMYGMYQGLQARQNSIDDAAQYKKMMADQDAAAPAAAAAGTPADPNATKVDPQIKKAADDQVAAHDSPVKLEPLKDLAGATSPKGSSDAAMSRGLDVTPASASTVVPTTPGTAPPSAPLAPTPAQMSDTPQPGPPGTLAQMWAHYHNAVQAWLNSGKQGQPPQAPAQPAGIPTAPVASAPVPIAPDTRYAQPGAASDVAAHGALPTAPPSVTQDVNAPIPSTQPGGPFIPPPQTRPPGYGVNPPETQTPPPAGVAVQPPAPTNIQPTPGPPQSSSLGSRILSMVNPVGSAQAAPVAAAPPGVSPNASVQIPPPSASGVPTGAGNVQTMSPEQVKEAAAHPSPTVAAPTAAAPPKEGVATAPVQAGPVEVASNTAAGKVAPQQQGPSQASESTPPKIPTYDLRPYKALATQRPPEQLAMVDKIANEYGIAPQRLALHWWLESRMHLTSPNSSAGAQGIMQVLPGTQKEVDPKGTLNPQSFEGSLRQGALYIAKMDGLFGKDTPSSILAYHQGPANAERFATDYSLMAATHPAGLKYVTDAYPHLGSGDITQASFSRLSNMNPNDIMHAAQGGPDGVLKYAEVSTAPNLPMQDKWRQLEINMVSHALARGDIVGAQHARDFVLQMSQQGATGYMMQAHQRLSMGDSMGAAQMLSRAYSFFPDGAVSRFGVDKSGGLWGQRFDEHDASNPVGPRFQVTADSLVPMMMQTRDPQKYLQMVTEQQKVVATNRLAAAHERLYDRQPEIAAQARTDAANIAAQARTEAAQTSADARVEAARVRADQKHEANTKQVDKETTDFGNEMDNPPEGQAPMSDSAKVRASQVYRAIRDNAHESGIGVVPAKAVAKGLAIGSDKDGKPKPGSLTVASSPGDNGKHAVTDGAGHVIEYLSPEQVGKLHGVPGFGPPPGQPAGVPAKPPVGAGLGTASAQAAGATGGSFSYPSSGVPVQNAPSTNRVQ